MRESPAAIMWEHVLHKGFREAAISLVKRFFFHFHSLTGVLTGCGRFKEVEKRCRPDGDWEIVANRLPEELNFMDDIPWLIILNMITEKSMKWVTLWFTPVTLWKHKTHNSTRVILKERESRLRIQCIHGKISHKGQQKTYTQHAIVNYLRKKVLEAMEQFGRKRKRDRT